MSNLPLRDSVVLVPARSFSLCPIAGGRTRRLLNCEAHQDRQYEPVPRDDVCRRPPAYLLGHRDTERTQPSTHVDTERKHAVRLPATSAGGGRGGKVSRKNPAIREEHNRSVVLAISIC